MFRIIARSAWTSTKPGGNPMGEPVRMTFQHHTAGPQPKGGVKATRATEEALIRATRSFHISGRGMSDIAYSFGAMPSGRIYALRGRKRSGGHTFNFNSISYGVVAFGIFETQKPSKPMLDGLQKLYARMRHQGWVDGEPHPTKGHCDVGAAGGGTACPGKNLYAFLRWISVHHPHAHRDHPHRIGVHHHHSHKHPHKTPAGHHHPSRG